MIIKLLTLISLINPLLARDEGFRYFTKVYEDCSKSEGVVNCLKNKAIVFFDRAARLDVIPLLDGVEVVRSPGAEVPVVTENEIEGNLARNMDKSEALSQMLWDRVAAFANSRTISLSLPKVSGEELSRSIEEGRGKMKKMMGMMMMGAMMKMAGLMPLGMAGLFVLAGKALIVAKIALLLSVIMILKKLMSSKSGGGGGGGHGGGHGGGSYGGGHDSWSSGGGGYDRRSYGADLAYSAYKKE